MEPKKTHTQQMIEKLEKLKPSLSEAEAELARYQIERLRDANPFLTEKNFMPHTVLEAWEVRDTSRTKTLASQLEKERNFLKGYKIFQEAGNTEGIEQLIDLSQKKIVFIQGELSQIERFIEDASEQKEKGKNSAMFTEKSTDDADTRRQGVANMTISELTDQNPLNKDLSILIYVDETLALTITQESIGTRKAISIPFANACRLEVLIESAQKELVGWLYFPIEDLLDVEDQGLKAFYYRIADVSKLSISFGTCKLEKKIHRHMKVDLVTKFSAMHTMRRLDSVMYYHCSVCNDMSVPESKNACYRCDLCKFTCHMRCAHAIVFECLVYLAKREEEEERVRLEEKILEIRKEKLRMIIAAVDIREKVKEGEESADRIQKPLKLSIESEEEIQTAKACKKYNVPHVLEKKKTFGLSWCSHCGEKITLFTQVLLCRVCNLSFHIDCKSMLFHSCGITYDLRIDLISFKLEKAKKKKATISLKEFTFVSVLGKGTFGKVFLAQWKGNSVAIKAIRKTVLIENNSTDMADVERRCLEIAQTSKNSFLVRLLECFQNKEYIFLVTEFMPGGDLYYYVYNYEFSDGVVQLLLAELVLAIEFLHKNNIIYRDLKLENILIQKDGHIKLTDFGLCSIGAKKGIARTFCGSVDSIAPEVISGKYTKTADWWSLGVIAYELVMRKLPFQGETPKRIYESIQDDPPEDMEKVKEPEKQLIADLLQKDPNERLGNKSVQEIKDHVYFAGIDWEKVSTQSVEMEWKPETKDLDKIQEGIGEEKPVLPEAAPVKPSEEKYFQNFQYEVEH